MSHGNRSPKSPKFRARRSLLIAPEPPLSHPLSYSTGSCQSRPQGRPGCCFGDCEAGNRQGNGFDSPGRNQARNRTDRVTGSRRSSDRRRRYDSEQNCPLRCPDDCEASGLASRGRGCLQGRSQDSFTCCLTRARSCRRHPPEPMLSHEREARNRWVRHGSGPFHPISCLRGQQSRDQGHR